MKIKLKPHPAKFSGALVPASEWLFCLKDEKDLTVWAFPGWGDDSFHKPYHYIDVCTRKQVSNLEACKHKPPKAYMKIWKTFLNLKMPMFSE